jgi:hypothetical protein
MITRKTRKEIAEFALEKLREEINTLAANPKDPVLVRGAEKYLKALEDMDLFHGAGRQAEAAKLRREIAALS